MVIEPYVAYNEQAFIPAKEWKRIFDFCSQYKVELLGWFNRDSNYPTINLESYINLPEAIILSIDKNNCYHIKELRWEKSDNTSAINRPNLLSNDIEETKNWVNYRVLLIIALCLSLIFAFLYPVMRKIEQPSISSAASQKINTNSLPQVNKHEERTDTLQINLEQQNEFMLYTVQNGDSLWEISKKYYGTGLDFVQIIKDNGIIINPSQIRVGTKLKIRKR